MRTLMVAALAGLLGVSVVWAKPAKPAEPADACGSYGTAVDFLETPKAAAVQAEKEQKLVFVLHISGHFEDPGVT